VRLVAQQGSGRLKIRTLGQEVNQTPALVLGQEGLALAENRLLRRRGDPDKGVNLKGRSGGFEDAQVILGRIFVNAEATRYFLESQQCFPRAGGLSPMSLLGAAQAE
jgi:hypothetical protein